MGPRIGLALGLAAALAACGGGGGDGGGGSATCTPTSTAGFTISATGVSPSAVCVLPGGTVTFTNSDTAAHSVASDGICTALDLGAIDPSTSKSATLPTVATCRFHDPNAASNTAFQGVVAVTQGRVGGGGY